MSYIEQEGRQFGLETRVRLRLNSQRAIIVHEIDAPFFTFPVLRMRLWSLLHGYGWPR